MGDTFCSVVLAAGRSTRMHGSNKLLLPVCGEPMIRRTVAEVVQAGPRETIVVVGHECDLIAGALADQPVHVQYNADFTQGHWTSVAQGVRAIRAPCDAVMVCLGDMVLLQSRDYRELARAFACAGSKTVLVPWHRGRRGNPVVFARQQICELVSGDAGASGRHFIDGNPELVLAHEVGHDGFVTDVDTPEDFAAVERRYAERLAASRTFIPGRR